MKHTKQKQAFMIPYTLVFLLLSAYVVVSYNDLFQMTYDIQDIAINERNAIRNSSYWDEFSLDLMKKSNTWLGDSKKYVYWFLPPSEKRNVLFIDDKYTSYSSWFSVTDLTALTLETSTDVTIQVIWFTWSTTPKTYFYTGLTVSTWSYSLSWLVLADHTSLWVFLENTSEIIMEYRISWTGASNIAHFAPVRGYWLKKFDYLSNILEELDDETYILKSKLSTFDDPFIIWEWKFDQLIASWVVLDTSSYNNTGSIMWLPDQYEWITIPDSWLWYSLNVNVVAEYVSIASNDAYNMTWWTLSAYVKPQNWAWEIIYRAPDINKPTFWLTYNTASIARYQGATNNIAAYFADTWWTEYLAYSATGSVSVNQWHHVAATYDWADIKLYLDGSLIKTENVWSHIPHAWSWEIMIGKWWTNNFIWDIDDVFISNRAFSVDEINELCVMTLTGVTSDCSQVPSL